MRMSGCLSCSLLISRMHAGITLGLLYNAVPSKHTLLEQLSHGTLIRMAAADLWIDALQVISQCQMRIQRSEVGRSVLNSCCYICPHPTVACSCSVLPLPCQSSTALTAHPP